MREGISRHKLLDFEAVSFSDDLVPATPLKLPDVEPGQYGLFFRDEFDLHTRVVIGGFSDGPGELRNPDGKTVHRFGDAPSYFSIPVPDGSDRKLSSLHHGNGRRLLMTVPPYLARSVKELLLPREVVECDVPQ